MKPTKFTIKLANAYLKQATELQKENANALAEVGEPIKETFIYKINEIKAEWYLAKYNFLKDVFGL